MKVIIGFVILAVLGAFISAVHYVEKWLEQIDPNNDAIDERYEPEHNNDWRVR